MRPSRLLVLALVLGGCPEPTPSTPLPHVYWVSPHGDDSGPGARERPWATIQHAADVVEAGDRVEIRRGTYRITAPIVMRRSGTELAWIEYVGHEGEKVVIDAFGVEVPPPEGPGPYAHDQGVLQLEGVAHVRIEGLTVRDAHQAGIVVRDSHHVALVGNTISRTYGSGISIWDTEHDDRGTEHIEVLGNTVTHANDVRLRPAWVPREIEPPHEAISIGGAVGFEVADNHVHHCGKEGIDVKETSKHGRVHHNHVHHVARQGIYVDGWFGLLSDVELAHNHVHDCKGAGLAVSAEGGPGVEGVRIFGNRVEDNDGTGLLFARWGDDGPRRRIVVERNVFLHNGHGQPAQGEAFHWITGGIFLYSSALHDLELRDNVVRDNQAFQIGVSEHWLEGGVDVSTALEEHGVLLERNAAEPVPAGRLRVGWPPDDYTWAYPVPG